MSYSEPESNLESDLESDLESEPAEVQPDNYIQECFGEAERTYQAWSTPPTPPPAPPLVTSGVQPAHTTRPTTRRGRGYLLTLLTSPVSVSEDNARPDTKELPATSSTSSRIVPTRLTVRVQLYARRIVTRQEEVLKMVTEEENAEIVAERWYINQQVLLTQKYQDLLNEIRRRFNYKERRKKKEKRKKNKKQNKTNVYSVLSNVLFHLFLFTLFYLQLQKNI
jgi:hypothetical protein